MNLFKPDNFKNDPYGHLTNQISHTALSLMLVYWFPQLTLFIIAFWAVWEVVHLVVSKDIADFFEDLFFELSGITVYFIPWWSFIVVAVLGITTWMRIKRARYSSYEGGA